MERIDEFKGLNLSSDYWEQLAPMSALIGRWIWDLNSGICCIDETLSSITGWDRPDLTFPAQEFLDRIHNDDLDAVQKAVEAADKQNKQYRAQFRFHRLDGSLVWFDGRGSIIDMEDGQRYLTGVNFDISDYVAQLEKTIFPEVINSEFEAIYNQTDSIEVLRSMFFEYLER